MQHMIVYTYCIYHTAPHHDSLPRYPLPAAMGWGSAVNLFIQTNSTIGERPQSVVQFFFYIFFSVTRPTSGEKNP